MLRALLALPLDAAAAAARCSRGGRCGRTARASIRAWRSSPGTSSPTASTTRTPTSILWRGRLAARARGVAVPHGDAALAARRAALRGPAAGPGSRWETLAELRVPGSDIRDPIFAPIGGRLLLYALTNQGFYAIPSGSVLAASDDGARWSRLRGGRSARLALLARCAPTRASARPAAARSGTPRRTGRTTASRSCCARRTAALGARRDDPPRRGQRRDRDRVPAEAGRRADRRASPATARLEVDARLADRPPGRRDAARLRRPSLHRVERRAQGAQHG